MAEEVSPESKLYVKEEIEKTRKEFKEDLEKARSKATITFSAVALIVGLLGSLGIYGFAKDYINTFVKEKLNADALKQYEENKIKLTEDLNDLNGLVTKAEMDREEIIGILTECRKKLKNVSADLVSFNTDIEISNAAMPDLRIDVGWPQGGEPENGSNVQVYSSSGNPKAQIWQIRRSRDLELGGE